MIHLDIPSQAGFTALVEVLEGVPVGRGFVVFFGNVPTYLMPEVSDKVGLVAVVGDDPDEGGH
jgi:hypothetical protein